MIFITGGTGLVGSHLLFELVSQGRKVRALRRSNSNVDEVRKVFKYYSKDADLLLSKIEWVEADILDTEKIEEFLDDVDEVYHTAAVVSFDPRDRERMMNVNVEGTSKLVDLILEKKIQKFCFVSSVASIGPMNGNQPADESSFWKRTRSTSWYSRSKFKSEMEVWRAMADGLKAVIVNPSIILGPGHWKRGSSQMFEKIYKGLPFYPNGLTGFVDVRDVVRAMISFMDDNKFGERYILSSENLFYKDVFFEIARCYNKKPPKFAANRTLTSLAWRLDWIRRNLTGLPPIITKETARSSQNIKYYSNQKIRETLDFEFTPINKTIKHICEVYLKEKNELKE